MMSRSNREKLDAQLKTWTDQDERLAQIDPHYFDWARAHQERKRIPWRQWLDTPTRPALRPLTTSRALGSMRRPGSRLEWPLMVVAYSTMLCFTGLADVAVWLVWVLWYHYRRAHYHDVQQRARQAELELRGRNTHRRSGRPRSSSARAR